MTLDEFSQRVTSMLDQRGLADEILMERRSMGGTERLLLTRKLPDGVRYLRITPIADRDAAWELEVLGGSYGNADPGADFDGRRGGSADYVTGVVRRWLVDLTDWNQVPPFESQG